MSLLFLSACAHVRGPSSSDGAAANRASGSAAFDDQLHSAAPPYIPAPSEFRKNYDGLEVAGVQLKNTTFDIPVTINSRVEYWVEYFTGRGRKHFERYLERSEFFIPYIVPILRQNGMPEDLVYQSMIESGFHNHARSHAKAVGPWQFIPGTGKRYGLKIDWWVDERRDTYKSTLAAVKYLKDLYGMFQSWELAAAAYNAGESKIARAIRRYGVQDYWVISRHSFLRPETRDYYPKIIAAAIVSKNRTQFGFPETTRTVHRGEVVAGDGELVKVQTEDEAAQPTPVPQGKELASVLEEEDAEAEGAYDEEAVEEPVAAALHVAETTAGDSTVPRARPVPTPLVSKKGQVSGEPVLEFEVQSPADLLQIARAAGLSYQTVKSLNPEVTRWCTPPTAKTWRVKLPASVKDQFLQTYNHQSFERKIVFRTHKVRPGETFRHIARRYGIRDIAIAELNGRSVRAGLRAGELIKLPIPNDRSRSMASLDVKDPPEKRRRRARKSTKRSRSKKYYKVTYKQREAARSRARRGDGG